MNREHLVAMRQQVLDLLLPLIMNGEGEPTERFSLIISAIRAGAGTDDLYNKAFEVANSIEDAEEKRMALYDLLGEIEADIDQLDDTSIEVNSSSEQTKSS